jgi:hypothetical protein
MKANMLNLRHEFIKCMKGVVREEGNAPTAIRNPAQCFAGSGDWLIG